MRKIVKFFKKLFADDRGQAVVEYVIIAAVLCLVLGATMPDFVDTLGDAYIDSEETIVDPPEETEPVIPDTFYTVKYDANGGTNAPEMQIKKPAVSLILSNQIPDRTDYTFQGWADSKEKADNLIQDYQPGNTYVKDESVILYASWLDNHRQYEMRFHTNAPAGTTAKFSDNTIQKITIKYHDTPAAIISDIPICTYYTFLGWNESPTATAATYTGNDTFNENRDVDFYAVWREIPYTVTYYANGGSGTLPAAAEYRYGTTVTVQNGSLTKAKMQFVGWSMDSIKTTVDYKAGAKFTMPRRNVILYAVYMPTDFPYNGTTGADGTYQTFTAPVDGTYQFQLWGARGGNSCSNGVYNPNGGPKGGYTVVSVALSKGQTIYMAVGGHGQTNSFSTGSYNYNAGGWNGGGRGVTDNALEEGSYANTTREGSGGGGGATSVYKLLVGDGQLKYYSNYTAYIIAVAGGGAGANYTGTDGYGGGYTGGNSSYAGTQTSGYSFGQGENATVPRRTR